MLPGELIARVRRIDITTRRLVDRTLAGQYVSVFKGRGMAFSEVRPYQPGDEIRTIDWNVSARMHDTYVKVFTEERELTVMLLVDLSRSQDFGTVDRTKGELAAELSALLAFSAIGNGDRVGAVLFTDRVEKFVPPKKGRRHVLALVSEILSARPVGKGTDLPGALAYLGRVQRRRTVTFVLSDFLPSTGAEADPEVEHALQVTRRRHDLVPVALADPSERELPALGIALVEDPETGESFPVDLRDAGVRRRYARIAAARAEARRRLFRRLDLDAIELACGEEYLRPLLAFFRARAKRMAMG